MFGTRDGGGTPDHENGTQCGDGDLGNDVYSGTRSGRQVTPPLHDQQEVARKKPVGHSEQTAREQTTCSTPRRAETAAKRQVTKATGGARGSLSTPKKSQPWKCNSGVGHSSIIRDQHAAVAMPASPSPSRQSFNSGMALSSPETPRQAAARRKREAADREGARIAEATACVAAENAIKRWSNAKVDAAVNSRPFEVVNQGAPRALNGIDSPAADCAAMVETSLKETPPEVAQRRWRDAVHAQHMQQQREPEDDQMQVNAHTIPLQQEMGHFEAGLDGDCRWQQQQTSRAPHTSPENDKSSTSNAILTWSQAMELCTTPQDAFGHGKCKATDHDLTQRRRDLCSLGQELVDSQLRALYFPLADALDCGGACRDMRTGRTDADGENDVAEVALKNAAAPPQHSVEGSTKQKELPGHSIFTPSCKESELLGAQSTFLRLEDVPVGTTFAGGA